MPVFVLTLKCIDCPGDCSQGFPLTEAITLTSEQEWSITWEK